MKTLKKITLLLLVSFACSNVNAGKNHHGYKKPDLRQQRQQVKQITKHLEKLSIDSKPRFERRHPSRYAGPSLSNKQRAAFVAISFMLLISQVNSQITEVKSAVAERSENSVIRSRPYIFGEEKQTFGPCETLYDDSKFCCDIGKNYTVTCCVHPDTTGNSYCISFDPGGIIGDTQAFFVSNTQDLLEEMEICKRQSTYQIAEETKALLSRTRHLDSETCGFYTSWKKVCYQEKFGDTNYPLEFELRSGFTCERPYERVSSNDCPFLVGKIEKLLKDYNLSKNLKIIIENDEDCLPQILSFSVYYSFTSTNPYYTEGPIIRFTSHSLQSLLDDEIYSILAHEVHHLRQEWRRIDTFQQS